MAKPEPRRCPIASTLQIIGERWSMLALREMFMGVHRFDAIADNTGATRDILANRLRKLEAAGLITRHRYSAHASRFEYHLTAMGRDLEPVLLSLREWGERYVPDLPEPASIVHSCGADARPRVVCSECGEPLNG